MEKRKYLLIFSALLALVIIITIPAMPEEKKQEIDTIEKTETIKKPIVIPTELKEQVERQSGEPIESQEEKQEISAGANVGTGNEHGGKQEEPAASSRSSEQLYEVTEELQVLEAESDAAYYQMEIEIRNLSNDVLARMENTDSNLKSAIKDEIFSRGTYGNVSAAEVISCDTERWQNKMTLEMKLDNEAESILTIEYDYNLKTFRFI